MPGTPTGNGVAMHTLNLLPLWVSIAWTAVFLAIAVSHVRHMAQTTGQRRPWHSCHVLLAVGMAFMYAPAQIDPLAVPSAFWRLVFAAGGVIAAGWAMAGIRRISTVIWLLTSIDMAAMLYMWSGPRTVDAAPLTWLLTAYLLTEAVMWALDLYRRLDGASPIVSWQLLAGESGAAALTASGTEAAASGSLLGELDISASMIAMTLGMAYMLVAAQLMT